MFSNSARLRVPVLLDDLAPIRVTTSALLQRSFSFTSSESLQPQPTDTYCLVLFSSAPNNIDVGAISHERQTPRRENVSVSVQPGVRKPELRAKDLIRKMLKLINPTVWLVLLIKTCNLYVGRQSSLCSEAENRTDRSDCYSLHRGAIIFL